MCRGAGVCPRGTAQQPAWLEGQCAQGSGRGEVNYEWNQVMAGPVGGAGNIGLILHFRLSTCFRLTTKRGQRDYSNRSSAVKIDNPGGKHST